MNSKLHHVALEVGFGYHRPRHLPMPLLTVGYYTTLSGCYLGRSLRTLVGLGIGMDIGLYVIGAHLTTNCPFIDVLISIRYPNNFN